MVRYVNGEFERMWKEAVVVCFKVISRHLPGESEEDSGEHQSE
jgi:hypothetical protein